MTIGFHASHEQVHPSSLLDAVVLAEQAGFDAAMCSDHIAPWSERQGQSGVRLVLARRGAAGDEPVVRRRERAGPALPPGDHRAGDRDARRRCTRAASGSRSARARRRTSTSPAARGRARSCATSACWSASTSSARCSPARRSATTGSSRSTARGSGPCREQQPELIAAAVSAETAGWAAEWADGLATVAQPHDALRQVVDAYRDGGGTGPPCCRCT